MKRIILLAIAACFLLVPLAGCCGGMPTFTFRSPMQVDAEARTVAAPRLQQMPTYYAPQYVPTAAPAQYAPPPAAYAPASAPCR